MWPRLGRLEKFIAGITFMSMLKARQIGTTPLLNIVNSFCWLYLKGTTAILIVARVPRTADEIRLQIPKPRIEYAHSRKASSFPTTACQGA